jgi:nucleoid-associated protein YgaU
VGPPPLAPGVGFPSVAPTPAPKSPSIGTIGNPATDIPITPAVSPSAPGNPAPTPGIGLPVAIGNKVLPPVTNHSEETRYTQPGDTSFDELSRKYYGTPAYGRALLEYNRNHPLAKTGLFQNPPVLQANQPIYYPDKGILEIRYNQLIQNGSTTAPVSVLPAVKISAPMPFAGPGNMPALNPPTADVTTDFRTAQPQFIFDIARQQLGDGMLWTEILRLNPALHTDQPIPAGTVLRLPKMR